MFDVVGMTRLVIPVTVVDVSLIVVAMVTAVIRPVPVRFELILSMREILLEGIVDNFYEIF